MGRFIFYLLRFFWDVFFDIGWEIGLNVEVRDIVDSVDVLWLNGLWLDVLMDCSEGVFVDGDSILINVGELILVWCVCGINVGVFM